jgi:hypothetical protein
MTANTPLPDRTNVQLAAAVDYALELLIQESPGAAAKHLTDSGARFATVVRVLAEPGRRRARTALDLSPPAC